MGLDRIFVFSVDEDTGRLIPGESSFVQATSGTGPRHFAVHPSGRFAYSVEEILFSLAAYSVDPRTVGLRPLQRLSLPPEDIDPSLYISGADVHVSPDGRSVYATLRGHDSIVNYRVDPTTGMLTRVDYAFTGRHSRAFGMD